MQVLFVRRKEAAKMLGVTPATLTRWDKSGLLKMKVIAPRVMGYPREELEKFATGPSEEEAK